MAFSAVFSAVGSVACAGFSTLSRPFSRRATHNAARVPAALKLSNRGLANILSDSPGFHPSSLRDTARPVTSALTPLLKPLTVPEFALPECYTADVTSPPTPSSYTDVQDSTTSTATDVSFQGVSDFADVFPQMLTSPLDQTALRRALLSAVPSLHTLDLNTLESILGSFSIRSFSSGDVISPSGGTGVFVLAQGSVFNLSVDNPLFVSSAFHMIAGQGFGGLVPSQTAFIADSDVIVYFISAEAVSEIVLADIFAAPPSDRLSLFDDLDLADFEVVRMLGRGSFGAVALVKHLPSDRFFVLKQVDHQESPNYCPQKEGFMADLITQTNPFPFASDTSPEFMASNARPFICRHIYTFLHDRTTFFLQEFFPGGSVTTLLDRIGLPSSHVARARVLCETDARFYLACLVLAVSHIHGTRHMHRDIKTANFMLDHLGYATLIDNSLLVKTNHHGVARGSAGTLSTMAPEVAKSLQFGYTFTADVWSLGAVLMKMITGSYPYDHSGDRKQLLAALRGSKPVSIPTNLSPDLTDLLTRLLEKDPDRRIGAEKGLQEIRDHPWFHGFDWGALERRELTPPFVPVISSPQDCQNLGPLDETLEMIKLPTSRRGAISDSD